MVDVLVVVANLSGLEKKTGALFLHLFYNYEGIPSVLLPPPTLLFLALFITQTTAGIRLKSATTTSMAKLGLHTFFVFSLLCLYVKVGIPFPQEIL